MRTDTRRTGALWGLAFAAIGLGLAISLTALLRALPLVANFPLGVTLGAAACLLAGWSGGAFVAPRVVGGSVLRASLLGICVAVLALGVGALMGSIPQFMANHDDAFGVAASAYDYLVKPLYWIATYGIVPAIILGISYGIALRAALRRQSLRVERTG